MAEIKYTERPVLPERPADGHKGTFGTALLLCGSYGMCGAEILAAKAALRCGVGLVRAVVCAENYAPFLTAVPAAVTLPVRTDADGAPLVTAEQLETAFSRADAVLIGCGLGRSSAAARLVKSALAYSTVPTVLDADGINAVCDDIHLIRKTKSSVIVTPHSGEMARLIGSTAEQVERDRTGIALRFARENGCITVLKGHRTVIAFPDGQYKINATGCSGMATGGSGDVLAGMLVSLLAQGMEPEAATEAAVWLHGKAGELAAERLGERFMLPDDLTEELKNLL